MGVLCLLAMSTKQPPEVVGKADVLTVFLTGNALGELQPCGCSGGQLGGFDRRAVVLNSVGASKRLIIDTGCLVEGTSEQDLIKFDTIIHAFYLLEYDLVNLAESDIETAKSQGLLDSTGSTFSIISAYRSADVNVAAKFTKQLPLKEKSVAVTVAAFDVKAKPTEQIGKLFSAQPGPETVNILIINQCDTAIIASIAKLGVVDCLVCPAESDEPIITGDPNERPLVVSVGRYGKYVGKLQIRATKAADKLSLNFLPVAVKEELPSESSLVQLYKSYQQLVKEANLLEKYPRFALPNGLEYTGSESCRHCHTYEYEKWSRKAHGRAYATLERVGSQFDPECVLCHVVGMEYDSGFVSEEKTGHLKDVGCENCHGPGSEHIKAAGWVKTAGPKSECADCHTPYHSAEYESKAEEYFQEIIHWGEPNIAGEVKEKGKANN